MLTSPPSKMRIGGSTLSELESPLTMLGTSNITSTWVNSFRRLRIAFCQCCQIMVELRFNGLRREIIVLYDGRFRSQDIVQRTDRTSLEPAHANPRLLLASCTERMTTVGGVRTNTYSKRIFQAEVGGRSRSRVCLGRVRVVI